jgi:hypothetical protein
MAKDKEISAIEAITKKLDDLAPTARRRVLGFVVERENARIASDANDAAVMVAREAEAQPEPAAH